jgi:autoinducer 2-binding protein LuxP
MSLIIRVLCGLLLSLWLGLGFAADKQHPIYWSLDQYLSTHPEQTELMARFTHQVQEPAAAIESPQAEPVKIALVYPGNQQSDYWRLSAKVFQSRLKELKINYQLETYFTQPSQEVGLQESHIAKALANDPDYLVYTLDSPRQRRIVERLLTRVKPKLILQNITTPVRVWGAVQPLLYVGFDHLEGTTLLARYLFSERPLKPEKIAVLFRNRGYVSTMRGDSFIALMQENGAELLSSYYTQANRESARVAALDALSRHPQLDFIYACATDLSLGALDALRETGRLGQVGVNGWGGGPAELEALARKELELTVMRMNDENGVAMAEAIKNDLEGRAVPQVYSGSFEIVTRKDSSATIEALRRKAFYYSDPNQQNSRE